MDNKGLLKLESDIRIIGDSYQIEPNVVINNKELSFTEYEQLLKLRPWIRTCIKHVGIVKNFNGLSENHKQLLKSYNLSVEN